MMNHQRNITIGLDIGLTKICASFINADKKIEVCTLDGEEHSMPAYVRFRKSQIIDFGKVAKDAQHKDSTVHDLKRIIGKRNSLTVTAKSGKAWRFSLEDGSNGNDGIVFTKNTPNDTTTITDILTLLIGQLIDKIRPSIPEHDVITSAVIAVPSQFSYQQTTETIAAVRQAGLEVEHVLTEATASALAYLHCSQTPNPPERMLFFDFGGGKLDASVVHVERNRLTVLAVAGNNYLGGRDIDDNLYEYMLDEIVAKQLQDDDQLIRQLKLEVERIKISLSKHERSSFVYNAPNGRRVTIPVTRRRLEQESEVIFQRCMEVVMACLKAGDIEPDTVQLVVISGGSGRMPQLQQLLRDFFRRDIVVENSHHMETATCYGNSVSMSKIYTATEVLSKSLGIFTPPNIMDVLIPRNSKVPITAAKTYLTTKSNQKVIVCKVVEGENIVADKNNIIGEVHVPIPPNSPPGYPVRIKLHRDQLHEVQVSYEYPNQIDSNHIYIAELITNRFTSDANADDLVVANNKIEEDEDNFRLSCASLLSYCCKIEALFCTNADTKGTKDLGRDLVLRELGVMKKWMHGLTYDTMRAEEVKERLLAFQKKVDPILSKHGSSVKHMNLLEFGNYISNKQNMNDEVVLRYNANMKNGFLDLRLDLDMS